MKLRKAANVLLTALMQECEIQKTHDQLTVEAWLWRQLGEPKLAEIVIEARDKVRA